MKIHAVNTSKFFRLSWALLGATTAVSLGACTPSSTTTAPTDQTQAATSAKAGSEANLVETIYVPGPDDKLHPKPVSFKSIEVPASALQEIVSSSDKWFPKGAKINNMTSTDKQITVDVNKDFGEASFWGEKGEKTTELAVYAIVNSASAKTEKPVQLTIEGKPVGTLGEFDASDAIEPRAELIAETPKPAKTEAASTRPGADKTPPVPTPVPPSAKQAQPTTSPKSE